MRNTIPRGSGGGPAEVPAGTSGAYSVIEANTIYEAKTGVDWKGAGPDAVLEFNAKDYLPLMWFDPDPRVRTDPVPSDRNDFMSVVLHELFQTLSFIGYRQVDGPGAGQIAGGVESPYDALTAFGTGGDPSVLYFNGSAAEKVYGGPVPLTSVGAGQFLSSQNFYHVGNPAGMPGDSLIDDLMNGIVFKFGHRYSPSALDLAILSDVRNWTAPPQVTGIADVG